MDHRLTFARGMLAAALVLTASVNAQQSGKAIPVFVEGEAQVVKEFSDASQWIHEELWVEASFDSDGDGKPDRMHVDVTRQKQTDTEGLKVAVVYETSPYYAGIGSTRSEYFWDPHQELGGPPKARNPMPEVPFQGPHSVISESQVGRWVPRGFAVVHSESPGTGLSQGCPTIGGDNESLAPKAVIDWLCGRAKGFTTIDGDTQIKATWCTGKVGMTGTSYNGTLPIAAATTGVDGLEAIIPVSPNTSYYHYYRSNGLVRHPGGYMGEDVDVLYDFIFSGDPRLRAFCNQHIREEELQAHQDRATGDFSAWWAGRDYLLDLGPLKAATLMAHGFNDWNVMPEHSVRIYAALKQKGIPCMAYFHQGGHGGEPPLPLMNKWFSRFLYGVKNGIEDGPHGWIVRETDRPRDPTAYADYPHPDAAAVTLFLRHGGNAVGGLDLTAVADQGVESLVDDVAKKGGELAKAEHSENRLLFATAELKSEVHLSGTARVRIKLACDKPAANLSVWVVSLPWTGSRRINDDLITRGWADPQNHASLEKGEPLVPGRFHDVAFDLQPDDQVIPAGARIGLMIFSSDREFTLWPTPGTKLTIDLDGTSLDLPVVGGATALRKALGGD